MDASTKKTNKKAREERPKGVKQQIWGKKVRCTPPIGIILAATPKA